MSCRAKRQSKCVDFDKAASASAGPPLKRPPHRLVRFSLTRITTQINSALRGDLGRQAEQVNESLGERLIERVALVICCEVVAVKARIRLTAVYNCATTMQNHANIAGHVLLRLVNEAVKSVLQRREPQAVVNELCPALLNAALEPRKIAFHCDVFEFLMRRDQSDRARSFVDFTRLNANETVFNHVDAPNTLGTGTTVELLNRFEHRHRLAVDLRRYTVNKRDYNLVGLTLDSRVLGVGVDVLGRSVPDVF